MRDHRVFASMTGEDTGRSLLPVTRVQSPYVTGSELCAIEGCVRPAQQQGWCPGHLGRWVRATIPMNAPFRPQCDAVCIKRGCEGQHIARGLCWHHYRQALDREGPLPSPSLLSSVCAVRGCVEASAVLGVCPSHTNPKRAALRRTTSKPRSRCRRRGERSKAARADRAAYDRRRRRTLAEDAQDALGTRGRAELLVRVRAGQDFDEIRAEMGVAAAFVWSRARMLPGWGRELDQALMDARNPALPHGVDYTYRRYRCRCPECRAAKARYR